MNYPVIQLELAVNTKKINSEKFAQFGQNKHNFQKFENYQKGINCTLIIIDCSDIKI
jgi:hypothetical protein